MNDTERVTQASHEHAWKYFELHSNQRMTLFNFFSAFSGVVVAAVAATSQAETNYAVIGIALGMLLAIVSFISWKLDQRMSLLVKHSERALIQIEGAGFTTVKLFTDEPDMHATAALSANRWSRPWTVGGSFRLLFVLTGAIGVFSAAFSLFRLVKII